MQCVHGRDLPANCLTTLVHSSVSANQLAAQSLYLVVVFIDVKMFTKHFKLVTYYSNITEMCNNLYISSILISSQLSKLQNIHKITY